MYMLLRVFYRFLVTTVVCFHLFWFNSCYPETVGSRIGAISHHRPLLVGGDMMILKTDKGDSVDHCTIISRLYKNLCSFISKDLRIVCINVDPDVSNIQ